MRDDDAFDLTAVLLGLMIPVVVWLFFWPLHLTVWLVRHPVRLVRFVVATIVLSLVITGEVWWLVAGAVALVTVGVLWRRRWPDSFDHRVTQRARGLVRSWPYRRRRWAQVCASIGLDAPVRDRSGRKVGRVVPARSPVWSTKTADKFTVAMLPGQTLQDWGIRAEALATALDVVDLRFAPLAPGRWWQARSRRWHLVVTAIRHDVLESTVAPWPAASVPNLRGLPVAVCEDGTTWRLPLLGNHVLVGGATGAGKGSALWSVVHHLAPAVATGTVRLYGFDPKAVELTYAVGLFHTLADGDHEHLAKTLEEVVLVMDARKQSMRGRSRLHTPTVAEPMIVVVIDELAALTAYAPAAEKKRISAALGLLLTQGRALGISVLAAAQDPRKETVPMRSLFTVRVGMRLNEPEDADMLLGQGARARGAIPAPVRVRFPWMSDQHIRGMGRPRPTKKGANPNLRVVPDQPVDSEAA